MYHCSKFPNLNAIKVKTNLSTFILKIKQWQLYTLAYYFTVVSKQININLCRKCKTVCIMVLYKYIDNYDLRYRLRFIIHGNYSTKTRFVYFKTNLYRKLCYF